MAKTTTLPRNGIGVRHANAALAAEFYATLDATHGNSAQAKSLAAILNRAEDRYARKVARIAARREASAESEPTAKPTRKAKAQPTAKATDAPKAQPGAKDDNRTSAERRAAAKANPCGDATNGAACVREAGHVGEHYAV